MNNLEEELAQELLDGIQGLFKDAQKMVDSYKVKKKLQELEAQEIAKAEAAKEADKE